MHDSRKSLAAKIIDKLLMFSSPIKRTLIRANTPPRTSKPFVPNWIRKRHQVSIITLNKRTIATITPNFLSSEKHIIFFHGGGYIFEITIGHWKFIDSLIKKLNCKVSVMNYPLAPEADYKTTLKWTNEAYNILISQYPDDEIILMGDSAGGGLAFAFTQSIFKDSEIKLPDKLILLSPWLDMTMSNPEIEDKEESDYLLSKKFLAYCADIYSKGDDLENSLLSPINGPLNLLPPTAVFYGGSELFCPDCRRLQQLCELSGARVTFHEYPEMQHDWMLFPIPEARKALSEIIGFINI